MKESDPKEPFDVPLGPPAARTLITIDMRSVGLVLLVIVAIAVVYVRAGREAQKQCVLNLHEIESAKDHWAMGKRGAWDSPTVKDLVGRTTEGFPKEFPKCPAGGTYTVGNMSTRPTCTIEGHKLD